jgi:hypothetical protein
MAGWIDMFRALGDSLIAVLRAEMTTLQEDLTRSGQNLGRALGFLGVVLILAFWIFGLLIFCLVALLAVWLPMWASALIVLLLFTAAAGAFGWLGMKRMREVENPVVTVRRRVDSHLDWWQNSLLRETKPVDVAPAGVTGAAATAEEGDLS